MTQTNLKEIRCFCHLKYSCFDHRFVFSALDFEFLTEKLGFSVSH